MVGEPSFPPGMENEVRKPGIGHMMMDNGVNPKQVVPLVHREVFSIEFDVVGDFLLIFESLHTRLPMDHSCQSLSLELEARPSRYRSE